MTNFIINRILGLISKHKNSLIWILSIIFYESKHDWRTYQIIQEMLFDE